MVTQTLTKALLETDTEIIYPDCDGQPMANNTIQFEWIVIIKQNIEQVFADNPNIFVAGDLFWYPVQGKPKIVVAPDVMVAIGRPKGDRKSYQQWNEENIPPQIIFEILSPSNTADEMDMKLIFFERHGVEEYYIYDPERHILRIFVREDDGLLVVHFDQTWQSPLLGIHFDMTDNGLVLRCPDGEAFRTFEEVSQEAEVATQRAEAATQRAEAATQRAEAAEKRSQKLAEMLKSLGVEEIN